jgi:predicted nuclease of predicted toxin-antitoxin system
MFPLSLVRFFKSRGQDAIHARNLGLKGAADRTIWKEAEETGAIVVSMDSDFPPLARVSLRARLLHYKGGNTTSDDLIAKFDRHLPTIIKSFNEGERVVDIW